MIYRTISFILAILLFSCTGNNRFPQKVTEKIPSENVKLFNEIKHTDLEPETNRFMNTNEGSELEELQKYRVLYQDENDDFNLKNFENAWNQVSYKLDLNKMNVQNISEWFTINSTLLELTGKSRYAREMERIIYSQIPPEKINEMALPYIFTRKNDVIHVNLFIPSEMNYIHTMKGRIKIEMETEYPVLGVIKIKFTTEKERYMELLVRIPAWAEGATVTAKGVKYLPVPGEYCQISKEWENGDEAEIILPIENEPSYLKQYPKF